MLYFRRTMGRLLSQHLMDFPRAKPAEQWKHKAVGVANALAWRLDLVSGRLDYDEAWTKVHGHPTQSGGLLLSDWLKEVHPDDLDSFLGALSALRSGASVSETAVYRRRHLDGHWLWFRVYGGISAQDAKGDPVALSGITFDITKDMAALHKAQEEQAQLREDLQKAQQRNTIAQMAGKVAHDVNNLIAVISGTVTLLEPQSGGHPLLSDGLDRIRRSVDMARDLVTDLGGNIRPNQRRERLDLSVMLRLGVAQLGSRRVSQHSIQVSQPTEFLPVWANATELVQLVMSLVLNGCEAGGTDRTATVSVAALPQGTARPARTPDAGTVPDDVPLSLFTVSDTGIGLSDDTRARMFRSSFANANGGGLGLLIVSDILHSNRAALWLDSEAGKGTTVTVAWPAEAWNDSDRNIVQRRTIGGFSGTVSKDHLKGLTVLVVDDMVDVADVLADMLEGAGAVACALSDPVEAREALADAPADWSVLVTDLHMPDMDGRALARFAAGLSPPVPAVLVTARPELLAPEDANAFSAVLSKPASQAQLAQAVYEAAAERPATPKT
jgi:signal transduction histidine kinase/CheY-like chemotaxis protein